MKRQLGKIAAAFLVLVSATGTATRGQSQNFTVLHSFTASPDGVDPVGGLLGDPATGNLYGTTVGGGLTILSGGTILGGNGTVFELDPAGNETILARFTIGSGGPAEPFAGVVRDAAGNLYGTSRDGGALNNGDVFKVNTLGNVTELHSFNCFDGTAPFAGVLIDASGNLYGTAAGAPACGNAGTVFKIDSAANFTVLHTFMGPDGAGPLASVIMDAAGNLYGTTSGGGTGACPIASFVEPCGTVFKLDPSGKETVLYSFKGGSDGANPAASLIMDAAGNFYGTTAAGGFANATCGSQTGVIGCGTVFKLDPTGNETVLYRFQGGSDGALPTASLVMDAGGNLYGTTSEGGFGPCTGRFQVLVGCGTVFKLDPTGNETILHSFTGGEDGATPGGTNPGGTLAMDVAGNLYGTAAAGSFGTTAAGGPCAVVGGLGGCGTVFKLAVQVPTPTITGVSPTSAIAGGAAFTLTVSGTNFVGGSTVNFNGNARATAFVSSTQLTATILTSDIAVAGTFNVTVTNPGGITSNAVSFTVVTPQDATQTIIIAVNTLLSQGVLNGGQDNSLVSQLRHAITMMNAGKNAGAIGNLQSFISEVNDLLSSGVLPPSQAASLISAAQAVIAAI